jgi:class 3 adenylate cyclase
VRIGIHASGATQVGRNFTGKGVHEAARIAALAEGGQILASLETVTGTRFPFGEARSVTLRGTTDPIEVAPVDWS